MKMLSRREEQVLLAVWELADDAYLLSVREYLTKVTRKDWSVGIIHKPLLQLEKKRFISSNVGSPTAKRGGRRKKMYRITPRGLQALKELKTEQDKIWKNFLQKEIVKETE
ncbi:MAG: helix-turn-helix transcriptional regulator [Candidatus Aminicenantes bacterium]|nr:helix-turn-helix transcriptional regulator [Candidatus Aminicenantes bacterium]